MLFVGCRLKTLGETIETILIVCWSSVLQMSGFGQAVMLFVEMSKQDVYSATQRTFVKVFFFSRIVVVMIDSSFTQQIHTFPIPAVQKLIAENKYMCVWQDVELAVTHCVCVREKYWQIWLLLPSFVNYPETCWNPWRTWIPVSFTSVYVIFTLRVSVCI